MLAEPIQTVMRRYSLPQPYEQLKTFTRGAPMTRELMHGFIAKLEIPQADKDRLLAMTPASYVGKAAALALHAHTLQSVCRGDGTLAFGAGLSDPDEPDAWLRDFTGQTRLWIEVGQPEDKPLAKACGKADAVVLYCFNHAAEVWWKGIENKLLRLRNLSVFRVPTEASQALQVLAQRSMQLQATVQDGSLMLANDKQHVEIVPLRWK